MVKHIQTIRQQKPTNCLSVFDHFVELALKGLKEIPFDGTFQTPSQTHNWKKTATFIANVCKNTTLNLFKVWKSLYTMQNIYNLAC